MTNGWLTEATGISERAPNFEVMTTHGVRKLDDYKGRWLILFSHPADFTPVCTSEFVGFAKAHDSFQELGCDLLGLSVDSHYSHLAWIRNIKENFGVEIPFPIIADVAKTVARDFGMIQSQASDVSTIRATFIIDPNGIIQAIIYYPMSVGRSIDEILRVLKALQIAEQNSVATPEGWQPGDKVIVPPPSTAEEAEARKDEDYDYTDWYYSKKDV